MSPSGTCLASAARQATPSPSTAACRRTIAQSAMAVCVVTALSLGGCSDREEDLFGAGTGGSDSTGGQDPELPATGGTSEVPAGGAWQVGGFDGAGGSSSELGGALAEPALPFLDCTPTSDIDAEVPAGGTSLIGASSGSYGEGDLGEVSVTGMEFATAFRASVSGTPEAPWSAGWFANTTAAVAAGDVILAGFWARCVEARNEQGECRSEFVFELNAEPYTKETSLGVRVGREWQRFFVAFQAADSYAAGSAGAKFRLGYGDQTIELGGLELVDYGASKTVEELPTTRLTWRGMEEGAAWRADALALIDRHRRGDLRIQVVDADGAPVPDAEVHVAMTRHGFRFGTAAPGEILLEESAEASRFRDELGAWFDTVTLENDFKWQPLAGDWGPDWTLERALSATDWLLAEGFDVRGHVLVWPGWRNLPEALQALAADPEALRAEVRTHVEELASATRGKVVHWDVVNEPYDNHDLLDLLGTEEMIEWFRIADEANPDAELYLNDYQILSGGNGETGHRRHYESMIRLLREGGAPLEGLGMQGHFGGSVTDPGEVYGLLERYSAVSGGLPVAITEYDVDLPEPLLEGCYTRDFLLATLAHPTVESFIMWGFWDGRHWQEHAPLYDLDWNLKPSGQVFDAILRQAFWTDETVTTDDDGRVALRAFAGEYEITVSTGGAAEIEQVTLSPDGATLVIELP